jgi:biopolymer transport protein ExbD
MTVQIKRGKALELFNLTPMIDMVFLLLIFFLVASRFEEAERELKVELPTASEAMPLTARPREVFINIDERGQYFVGGRVLSEEQLGEHLTAAARNNPLSQTVVIRADKRAEWDYIARAMNLCVRAGIRDYTTATTGD